MRSKFVYLMAIPLALMACNSITGTQPANAPTLSAPIKNCIDDFRAVHIVQPCVGTCVETGTRVMASWEVVEFCSDWDAELEVSYDNMQTWERCSCTRNGCSGCIRVPDEAAGQVAWVKVTVRDVIGEVEDIQPIRVVAGGLKDPQQRD